MKTAREEVLRLLKEAGPDDVQKGAATRVRRPTKEEIERRAKALVERRKKVRGQRDDGDA